MRLKAIASTLPGRFKSPSTWGAALAYGAGWSALHLLMVMDRPPMLSPATEILLPFLLVIGQVTLGPLPWLWTGDDRFQAPPWRGIAQAIPWNVLWLGGLMALVIALDPRVASREDPDFHLRFLGFARPIRSAWGIFFLNLPMALILGWFLAGKDRAEASERELRERSRQARAQALQAQLNPHVLFNVLGGLTELVHEDPDAAEEALVGLVEMYRDLVRHGAAAFLPLAQERTFVARYLGIEAIRLGERLRVIWEWPEWAGPLPLPPLLLQPLVENAIKHGIGPCPGGGQVRIAVSRTPGSLILEVANTGLPPGEEVRDGTGLGNLRERLVLLPALRPHLTLEREGDWTVARITLAWRWPA